MSVLLWVASLVQINRGKFKAHALAKILSVIEIWFRWVRRHHFSAMRELNFLIARGLTKRVIKNVRLTYPRGFRRSALSKSPIKIWPIDLVVPQNGQGSPVTFRNMHKVGPVVNPDDALDNTCTLHRKIERIKTRIDRLIFSKLAIWNLEMKNWAVRFTKNLTAQ